MEFEKKPIDNMNENNRMPETVNPEENIEEEKSSKEKKKEEKNAKKEAAARKKAEAKAKKAAEAEAKAAEKRKKKAAKKAAKEGKITLGKIIVDEAADVISTHDRIQASVDRFFAAMKYSLVYEMNDARIRYKHNATGMLTAFFGTIVIICFMLLVFDHETSYQYSYNGRILGYVDDQEQVYNILNIAGEKLSKVNDAKIRFKVGQNITFKKVSSSNKDIDTADQALNKLTYMTEIDVVGYGIYEKDRLLAVVESKSVADKVLDDVVNYYRTPDKGMQLQKIGFKHHVEVKPVNVMLTSVMTRNEAEDILENGGKMSLQHIVMEDENTAKLQEIYSADSQEIRVIGQSDSNREEEEADTTEKGDKNVSKGEKKDAATALSAVTASIRTPESGDKIEIDRKVEPITVEMTEDGTMSEVIEYKTIEKKTKEMYRGDREVTQKGVNGRQIITGTVVYQNGKEVKRDIREKEVLKKSVDKIVLVGTNDKPKWYPTGHYIIPVKNEVITSYFGSRWGRIHGGLDFGMPIGTPIYASDGGTVTRASYFAGYGLCVEVTHNNGTFTRYGHCSAVKCKVGDKVAQGQKIALVGNTGNSTGPHLHFEIHPHGGEYVDPYPYLYGSNKGNQLNNE